MSDRQLPPDADLHQLKNQAKDLVKACRQGYPDAVQRLTQHHPKFSGATPERVASAILLTDAQLVVAREFGFDSWPKLKEHVESAASHAAEGNGRSTPARERDALAGFTDYAGYPIEDMLRHLVELRTLTRETIDALVKLRRRAQKSKDRLEAPHSVIGYCEHSEDMFDRYAGDFDRLVNELPNGVRPRHLEIIRQLLNSAGGQDEICIAFKQDHIEKSLKDEAMRGLLDEIYRESRGMIVSYADLRNMLHRLKTFVDDDGE